METKETSEFSFTSTSDEGQLWVLSKDSGNTYRIDLKDFVCSCEDFKFRHAKGDRMCKHLKAAAEVYKIEPPKEKLPAVAEGQAITFSQEEVMQELSTELRDEMVKNYVYAVPDYEREYTVRGEKKKVTKPGWIDLKATGVRDLAHMVADRYGHIQMGEFRFMDVGDRWIAWRDIKLGNFTATGFAECSKDREFPFRYLGNIVMRNAYKAIVPKIYQDIFTNKFRELMRSQLRELLGHRGEGKLGKPIEELTDGELAKHLKEAQERKALKSAAKTEVKANDAQAEIAREAEVVKAEIESQQIQGDGFRIDPDFLKEGLKALKWSDDTCKTFLVSKYKVSGDGTLAEVLQRLTRQQAEEFTKELSERLAQRRMI
jgi:regulator of protease activity HflC (stomatin/prohibitin superfamily)